jgi:hypothetical protein
MATPQLEDAAGFFVLWISFGSFLLLWPGKFQSYALKSSDR